MSKNWAAEEEKLEYAKTLPLKTAGNCRWSNACVRWQGWEPGGGDKR